PKPQNPKTPKPQNLNAIVAYPHATQPMLQYNNVHTHRIKPSVPALSIIIRKHIASKMDTSNPDDSSPFPALCNLTSFVVNSRNAVLELDGKLTSDEVSVLIALLTSGAEIERLHLEQELPAGTGAKLGEAIKSSGRIRLLYVQGNSEDCEPAPELSRLVAVSPSPALEELAIWHTKIDDEYMGQLFSSLGTKLTTLRNLMIERCNFNIPLLAEWIGKLQALELLQISCYLFPFPDAGKLVVALRKLPAITNLSLVAVKVRAENWRQLGGSFLRKLKHLRMHNNELNDEEVSAIVDAILDSGPRRCGLESLALSFNDIKPAGAKKISELIACSPRLRCLELAHNHIESGIAPEALKPCANSLEKLDIRKCRLGPRGIVPLLAPNYYALTTLKMDCNRVGNQGAGTVAEFLLHSGGRTLKKLHMRKNKITKAGALKLAKGLTKAYALRAIVMKENPLGPRGAAAILDALATVSKMPMLDINFYKCEIGDGGALAVGRLIMRRGCANLDLLANKIHTKGAKAIADSLSAPACIIEWLKLIANELGDEGIKYLLDQIIRKNEFVCNLYLSLDYIGVEGAMAAKRVTEVQGKLSELVYTGEINDMNAKAILDEAERVSCNSRFAKFVKL
ncbi:MAG: hypothetical protein P4L50_16445, partial [Anaerolineaceae bacterium]|nr:hypothetical protein [Anaerolineaceae bacterium]